MWTSDYKIQERNRDMVKGVCVRETIIIYVHLNVIINHDEGERKYTAKFKSPRGQMRMIHFINWREN